MKAIVAVDQNWGIGKDGGLLTYLPGDLKYFKEKTLGKVVVMGRETLESLPGKKPLKDRTNIVLTRNPDYQADCLICRSMGELFKTLESFNMEDVFIIGGETVYRQFLPYCNELFVTKIEAAFEADKHFENLDLRPDLEVVAVSEPRLENGLTYRFTEYRRK
ncbi:dihydrofolate reductase [Sinanaerobacter chloroacetimidivorans]|jgi:dihydrofolate reductase|uniref:dihydrofolate reductase n=1 Tax=Sinanaerobacter chloroacetimidivorans TaxID=2818044 RepID=A0A8J8B147_9FIRM|nr:dihydrofolate reductase [Sinanaerobacter chloroacetimidivorans]MBR0597281.1 dihydrofolate reductase [Sinanaerobacter chloroacetimidivorans]